MSTQPPSINFEPVKKWLVYIISILALIVSVATAINGALPAQIGEPPIAVTNQGVSNLDTLQVGDGSASEPAFGFTADTNTGMYRVGADNIGLAVGGSKIVDVTSGGLQATTITVTNLISTAVGFTGATADLTGALTADSAAIGGGYSSTGCDILSTGVLDCVGAVHFGSTATITGALSAASAAIGGGYSSTGCDMSAAGNLACAGTLDIDGATAITGSLTAASASIGGGYSSTGCDILATGVLNCAGDANIGGAVNITGTISKSGVSFTGVAKWGTAASYTSGSSITHGFATTPTVCFLQPARDVTSTLTITATGFSSDMATVAVPIYWMCGQ